MPDPREEAAAISDALGAMTDERDALRARLAEAEAKHAERINAYGRDGDDARRREGEAVARAETAEAACETSGAALVVMNDLLKEAEAARDALTEALEKIRDAPQPESGWRIARAALAAVKGREACGHRAPLNYDGTRHATCTATKGHDGDHGDGTYGWTDRTMPCRVKGREDA